MFTAEEVSAAVSKGMGDKSPKNIHKKAVQVHSKEADKVQSKKHNAENQNHPISGHPPVAEKGDKKK
jgi:hypothetical protein